MAEFLKSTLWDTALTVEDKSSVKKQLTKINNPKSYNVVSAVNSKSVDISTKLKLIAEDVHRILGVYEENTQVIKTKDEFIAFIDIAINNGVVAVDTETNNSLDPITCKLMGLCLYTVGQKNAYIPINHTDLLGVRLSWQLTEDDVAEQLGRLSDTKILMHNGKFDYQVIKCTCGIALHITWDTLIGAKLLDENEQAGLKWQYINKIDPSIEKYDIEHLFKKIEYNYVAPELFALYAATDAFMTYKLYEYQLSQFSIPSNADIYKLFLDVEMPMVIVTAELELTGICIDTEYAQKLLDKYNVMLKDIKDSISKELHSYDDKISAWRLTPEANVHPKAKSKSGIGKSKNEQLDDPVSTTSPSQLAILLYDVLKLPSYNSKSPRSTDEETLGKIYKKHEIPLCNLILEQRGLEKLINTYIVTLPADVNPKTGRLHAKFNQYGAKCVTGDSLILTDGGYCTIDSLFDGTESDDEMLPIDVNIINRNLVTENATYRVKYTNKPTIKITTSLGYTIEGTHEHPILISDVDYSVLKTMHKKPEVLSLLKQSEHFEKLHNLTMDSVVVIPFGYNVFPSEYQQLQCNIIPNQTYKNCNHIMPSVCNEDFAELLGMYHADGTFKDRDDGFNVAIHNKDADVINRVTELVRKLFNVDTHVYKDSRSASTSIYFGSRELREFTMYLSKGARNKDVPEIIKKSPRSVVCAYLRGLTLDSSVNKEKHSLVLSCNPQTANFVQSVLLNLGIISFASVKKMYSEYDHAGNRVGQGRFVRISVSGDYYKKFLEEVGVIQSSKRFTPMPHTKYWIVDNHLYVPVKCIEESFADVYDIHVPGTHSFISNGLISHNTGRLSSSEPNLQNIPSHNKEIRLMFVPSKGCLFCGSDFSQQEPRIFANFCQDENMVNSYMHNKDLYATMAAGVYHNNYEDNKEFHPDGSLNPEGAKRRSNCKSLLLGLMYGRGIASIAEQLHCSIEEAQQISDSFFESFPKAKAWMDNCVSEAKVNGYVLDLWGRKRRLPDIQLPRYSIIKSVNASTINPLLDCKGIITKVNTKDAEWLKKLESCRGYRDAQEIISKARNSGVEIRNNGAFIAQAERQCVNARIQGSAATQSKKAMIAVHNSKELRDLGFKLLLPVHDELIGECPIENIEEAGKILSALMRESGKPECQVPMKCDVSVVARWYEDNFSAEIQSTFEDMVSDGMDEISAENEIIKNNPMISVEYLREMMHGTYQCAVHERICG